MAHEKRDNMRNGITQETESVPQRNSRKKLSHCQKPFSVRRKNRHYGSSYLQSHLIEDRRHSCDVEGRRDGKSHTEKFCPWESRDRFHGAATKLSRWHAAGGTFRRIYLDVSSSSARVRNMGVRIEFGVWVPIHSRACHPSSAPSQRRPRAFNSLPAILHGSVITLTQFLLSRRAIPRVNQRLRNVLISASICRYTFAGRKSKPIPSHRPSDECESYRFIPRIALVSIFMFKFSTATYVTPI